MSLQDKGGSGFHGIKLLLCENPLPPLDEAVAAACAEASNSNYYTEAYSEPLRRIISEQLGVSERLIHINAGSELILRQLFDRFGRQVHLLTPTYVLFPEIARRYTETRLPPENDFAFALGDLQIPDGTTLAVIVNPNNPNGGIFAMERLPELLLRHPRTLFLVDEAFIGLAGDSVAHLVPAHSNLLVTRTLSKAHSLAGFRVGYAILPKAIADDLNRNNDAYPLARPSQAAAIATLLHEEKIRDRGQQLQEWTVQLATDLQAMGVQVGVDPSPAMLKHARARGIEVVMSTAEALPFANADFDYVLVVTTICFVDSPARMLEEARRVLKPGGRIIIGFIDRESDMGRHYEAHKNESDFYRDATFHSSGDVQRLLDNAGFSIHAWAQTLAKPLAETREIEAARPGRGHCAFVVCVSHKPGDNPP